MGELTVSLVAVDRKVWTGVAKMVVAKTVEGEMGIMPAHEPVLAILADGTAAHLAGCLGKPSLTLLPFRPHWLYGLRGENTTWYPASRLLRQPAPGDWSSVMRDATALLRGWSKARAGSASPPTSPPAAGDTP